MKFIKNLFFHKDKHIRTLITLLYTLAGFVVNYFMLQVFCVPVWWAALFFAAFFISLLLFPYAKSYLLKSVLAIGLGAGVFISLYLSVFLSHPSSGFIGYFVGYILYLIGILFLGLGLLAFIPFYYLHHIYKYFKQAVPIIRYCFVLGLLVPTIITVAYLRPFKSELQKFHNACGMYDRNYLYHDKDMQHPELFTANKYTEQFLGIGIKYHTELDFIYDGWRPPVHDPLLNIGLWLYSDTYYPARQLNRVKYYKRFFPNKDYKVSCLCSYTDDGKTYFDSSYWHWQ